MPLTLRRPRATAITLSATVLIGAIGVTTALGGFQFLHPIFYDGGRVDTVGAVPFERPLAIPALAPSVVDSAGRRTFDLTASASHTVFANERSTPTWGFNGSFLGPTLVAKSGEEVMVNVRNDLDAATAVHWHGMKLPAEMDGGPHQMIATGESWSPEWAIDQPAATLWYHPHPHGATETHVANGLAGMFIVQDDEEAALAIPRDYGVDDIPVIVQDTRFAADGTFDRSRRGYVGTLGDTLLVNGTIGPYLDVTTESVRLRLLNASTARTYDFGMSDDRRFDLIATDGGLLDQPRALSHVQLSPGERVEIIVTMAAGETVTLRSTPPDLGMTGGSSSRNGGADRFDVLELRAASQLSTASATPTDLVPVERLLEEDASTTRDFELTGFGINDQSMDLNRIDEVVEVGSTEIWAVRNGMSLPHSFHIHGVQFQVLDIDGDSPPAELSGWKDTIYLPPDVSFRLMMRFENEADADHPFMYHCHLLWHEDQGMMGQIVVVEPGESAGMLSADLTGIDQTVESSTRGGGHDHR